MRLSALFFTLPLLVALFDLDTMRYVDNAQTEFCIILAFDHCVEEWVLFLKLHSNGWCILHR